MSSRRQLGSEVINCSFRSSLGQWAAASPCIINIRVALEGYGESACARRSNCYENYPVHGSFTKSPGTRSHLPSVHLNTAHSSSSPTLAFLLLAPSSFDRSPSRGAVALTSHAPPRASRSAFAPAHSLQRALVVPRQTKLNFVVLFFLCCILGGGHPPTQCPHPTTTRPW